MHAAGMKRLALLVFVLFACAAPAHAAGGWRSYVLAPGPGLQKPERIVATEGEVDNPEALVTGEGTTTMTAVAGATPPAIIVDFGKELGGFSEFDVESVTEAPVLAAAYSETFDALGTDGDYAGKTRTSRTQVLNVTKPGRLRGVQVEGGQRYGRLTLTAPGTVVLSAAGIRFTGFRGTPQNLEGYFLSSDDLLNRIWYAGVYTLNLNQIVPGLRPRPGQFIGAPVIIDGAKRDRRIWSGDLLTAGPTVYYALDPVYVRESLEVFARYPATDATVRLPASGDLFKPGPLAGVCSPITKGDTGCKTWSSTYSMAFVTALADYYRFTGNRRFVERVWPAVDRQMAWNATQVDDSGLFLVNEATGYNWNLEVFPGELTYVNSVYHQALLDAAELADAVDRRRFAAVMRGRAETIAATVNDTLWSPDLDAYDVSTALRGPVVQDANVAAVLSGIAPPARAERALDTVERELSTRYGTLSVSQPFPDGFRPIISPFMGGLQLKAQFSDDRTQTALDLIRSEWGQMVDSDPGDVMWEKIQTDGTLAQRSSAAHAWSTGPTSALSRFVLGAAPVRPGWKVWSVRPQPGDVEWTRGSVPTRRGPLKVRWQQGTEPASFELVVNAPEGTRGAVWIPLFGHKPVIERDGEVVWRRGREDTRRVRRDGDYIVFGGQAGKHRFTWESQQGRKKD